MANKPTRFSVEEEFGELPSDLPPPPNLPPPPFPSASNSNPAPSQSFAVKPVSDAESAAHARSRSGSDSTFAGEGLSMSSPVIGRVQRLGLRPIDNGDMNARMYLVDGVEVTMPMSALSCPVCFAKFDEEAPPVSPGKKKVKLLHKKIKCTTCLKMVCSSCSKLVKLESYGETESRKICFPCLEDVKKKIELYKTAGRGTGRAAPPDIQDRKAVSAPWAPMSGRGLSRRASVGGRGDGGSGRGRGSGFSSPGSSSGAASPSSVGGSSPPTL